MCSPGPDGHSRAEQPLECECDAALFVCVCVSVCQMWSWCHSPPVNCELNAYEVVYIIVAAEAKC